jgi:hypothetical protein
MKICIIGSGALALESAVHFYELGAHVRLFAKSSYWGGALARQSDNLEDLAYEVNKLPTMTGRNFAEANTDLRNLKDYLSYLSQLGDKLTALGVVKKGEVLRVHKRFLNPGQEVEGRSRLADLFRVVYRIDARKDIEEQKEQNKEIFEKLGEDVVESLKNSIESYEDFDIVLDATGPLKTPRSIGPSYAPALNEAVISQDEKMVYGEDVIAAVTDMDKSIHTVTFVGDGYFNLAALGILTDRFKNSNLKVQIITQSSTPFDHIDSELYAPKLEGFKNLLAADRMEFKNAVEEFEKKIMEWRSLDSHIQVKTPKPTEPLNRIFVYNGAIVSSVDKLLDQKGLFLTIEGSQLLGSEDILKTISSDLILVDNGYESHNYTKFLDIDEPGFFSLRTHKEMSLTEMDFAKIKDVEEELMKYFSKA